MKRIAIILIATFALFSCAKENMDGGSSTTEGVRVLFKTSDFTQLNTRAVNEIQLKDVTILQFKGGLLVHKEVLENTNFSSTVTLENLKDIPAANLDENGKLIEDGKENLIYFIANAKVVAGETALDALTVNSSTFADIKNLKFGTNNLSEVLPMTGQYYGGVQEGATTQINVILIRAVAKVNFTLNTTNFTDNGAKPSIIINSITLCDVPKEITPYPCDNRPTLPANGNPGVWADIMTPFPAYGTEGFETYGIDKNNSATPLTNYVAYMPENARGSFPSIANNKNKKPESVDAQYQGGLTYILVDLDYTSTSGVSKNATYKIYIGGDAAGDMNLLRNTQYNITTYIYGANEADTRITVTPIFDPEDGLNAGNLNIQQPANCYIINPASIPANFTIPVTQARRGWNYIKSSENNEALLKTFDDLIKTGNWEIITLWKTWSGASNITGTKASGVSFEGRPEASEKNYFATLTFPEDIPAGNNAVIALVDKNDNNKIYWSWHLWFTDYNPDATPDQMNGQTHSYFGAAFQPGGAYFGKVMMDRNLGATATGVSGAISQPTTTAEAVSYYGLFYQFGRKDPFVGSSSGNANAKVIIYNSNGEIVVDVTSVAGSGSNLSNAINNPMTYYTAPSGNWTAPNEDLWNSTGGKSAFDPCPPGWRVPKGSNVATDNPWAGFSNDDPNSATNVTNGSSYFLWKEANTSGSNVAGSAGRLYLHADGTQAWYPASGCRHNNSSALSNINALGAFWSLLPSSTNGVGIYFNSTNVNPISNMYRSTGYSVRCVKE